MSIPSHEALVSAVIAAVEQPITKMVEVISKRFEELSSDLKQAVRDTDARVLGDCLAKLPPQVAAELAPQLASELNEHLSQVVHRAVTEAPPEASPQRRRVPTASLASSCKSHASSWHRSHSNLSEAVKVMPSTKTAQSSSDSSERNIRALEATLADQLLEESGLAVRPPQGRRKRRGSRAADECAAVLPGTTALPPDFDFEPTAPPPTRASGSAAATSSSAPVERPTLVPGAASTAIEDPLPGAAKAWPPDGEDEEAPAHPNAVSPPPSAVRSNSSTNRSLASPSRVKRRPSTAGEILQVRIQELTEEIPIASIDSDSDDDDSQGPALGLTLLAVSGLIPWDSVRNRGVRVCYQGLVGLLAIAASVTMLVELVNTREGLWSAQKSCEGPHTCWRQRGLLSDVPIAAGCMAGFVLLRPWRRSGLSEALALFHSYARHADLSELWQRRAKWETRWTLAVWMCAVVPAVVGMLYDSSGKLPSQEALLSAALFFFLSGIFLCLCLSQLYVCRALMMFVDQFCCSVVDSPVIYRAAHEWNVLQAVLRKGSGSIEPCFIVIQGLGAFTVPLLIADFFLLGAHREAIPTLIPGIVLTVGILRIFFLAAAVTDKCGRVPSLLNTLTFGPSTELKRQYIVEYTAHSAAGFYVLNVRLTTSMALRFLYMWMVVAFGLSTRFFST